MKPLQYLETQTKIEPPKVKITRRPTFKSSLRRTAIKMRTGGAESARKDIRGVQNERRNEHQNLRIRSKPKDHGGEVKRGTLPATADRREHFRRVSAHPAIKSP